MAERVEIMVVAKDAASQVFRGLTSNFGTLGNMVQGLTSGGAITALTEQFIALGKESVESTIKYANEVRSLSMVSGESAENSSRFLQVLDDYKISATDAMAATRAMTKEGLKPNLETLAKLSDEYLSITDKEKQNEFVIKNLGRAGLQWVEVLNKGSKALLAQGDAVSEGLILNQKQLDQVREMEIAQDVMNESWEKVSLTVGMKLIPAMTGAMDEFNNTTRAIEIMREQGLNPTWEMLVSGDGYINALKQAGEEANAQKAAMLANAEAADVMTGAHEKTKEELKAEEDAIKALTKANEDYLGLVGTLAGNLTDYQSKHDAIQQELNEGKITLEEAGVKWQQLADEQEKATFKMILNMMQQRLAEDGLDAAETAFLLQQGVEWGIYSQTAVDQANAVIGTVDNMIASYQSIPAVVETNIVTNHIDNYLSGASLNAGVEGYRAGGGDVKAGELYRVNETRTEYFRPSMSGEVIPLGGSKGGSSGSGINITLSPMIMAGDRSNAENVLLPVIIEGIRKAKADRII